MTWEHAKRRLNSRFVRSAYFWLFFVPICAHALSLVSSPILIDVGGSEVDIQLGLPFSWKWFYFGSVSFAIASFLYSTYCPPLIRDFDSFEDYQRSGRGSDFVCHEFHKQLLDKGCDEASAHQRNVQTKRFVENYAGHNFHHNNPGYSEHVKANESDENAMKVFDIERVDIRQSG